MCFSKLFKKTPVTAEEDPLVQKTVEELVAENSAGMTDSQKAEYWYELSTMIFNILGKIEVPIFNLAASEWYSVAKEQYSDLTEVKFPDSTYYTTDITGIQLILIRDWANLVKFTSQKYDCDDFSISLYNHLVYYYGITGIVPVWGETSAGYHAFNLAVLKETSTSDKFVARLIEPQSDTIFIDKGTLGTYEPKELVFNIGKL